MDSPTRARAVTGSTGALAAGETAGLGVDPTTCFGAARSRRRRFGGGSRAIVEGGGR